MKWIEMKYSISADQITLGRKYVQRQQ